VGMRFPDHIFDKENCFFRSSLYSSDGYYKASVPFDK